LQHTIQWMCILLYSCATVLHPNTQSSCVVIWLRGTGSPTEAISVTRPHSARCQRPNSLSHLASVDADYAPCILHASLDKIWIVRMCETFYDTLSPRHDRLRLLELTHHLGTPATSGSTLEHIPTGLVALLVQLESSPPSRPPMPSTSAGLRRKQVDTGSS
jgi:hypothetical protein